MGIDMKIQKIYLIGLLSAALFFGCKGSKTKAWDPGPGGRYTYDPATGTCANSEGSKGMNPLDLERARSMKDCECMDLIDTDLVDLLPDIDPGDRVSYHVLDGYNFRGAGMSRSYLHFNHIENADLSGAKMNGMSYGYAHIYGTIDAHTQLPVEGCRVDQETLLECNR